MEHDVIIVGGSYSGMAAALQLLRARRSVLVIDAGAPRNRFASHSHGFLGQDGIAPADITRTARRQLESYPTLAWVDGVAVALTGSQDDFVVRTGDGQSHRGRRVVFATGVSDQLPAIPGLRERWGKTVFHCPYCHGYELDPGPVGVIATNSMSSHQAELLTEWGNVTFLLNAAVEPDPAERRALAARGVVIEDTPIDRIEDGADVVLADGRRLRFGGLFVASHTVPSSQLPAEVGAEFDHLAMGVQIRTDESKQTTIPGIFACGDTARMPHSVSLAVGDGAMTGVHVHRSLIWPGS